MKRSNSFTLLEILICLVLLTMVGTFATIRGYSVLQDFRSKNSYKRLIEESLLSQSLSSSYRIDIELELHQEKNRVILVRKTDLAPVKIANLFNKKIELPNLILNEENEVLRFYPSILLDPVDRVKTIINSN